MRYLKSLVTYNISNVKIRSIDILILVNDKLIGTIKISYVNQLINLINQGRFIGNTGYIKRYWRSPSGTRGH